VNITVTLPYQGAISGLDVLIMKSQFIELLSFTYMTLMKFNA